MSNHTETTDSVPECTFDNTDLRIGSEARKSYNVHTWGCSRPAWEGTEEQRCIWHADAEEKSSEELEAVINDGDLHGAILPAETNLRSVDFPGDLGLIEADLSRVNLSGCDLTGSNLYNANLSGATITSAHLCDADLFAANLSDADLFGADLSGARITEARLADANLSNANLSGANLLEASLPGAGGPGIKLIGARLEDTDLTDATLSGNLSHANFRNADLTNAQMHDADLSGVNLHTADLTAANLRRIGISGEYMFSPCASDETDLIFASYQNKGHSIVGANLPSNISFDLSDADGVIRKTVNDPYFADIALVDDIEEFNSKSDNASYENIEYVQVDFDIDEFSDGPIAVEWPNSDVLESDLIFISANKQSDDTSEDAPDGVEILGEVDFSELSFHSPEIPDHGKIKETTGGQRPSRPLAVLNADHISIRQISSEFIDCDETQVEPAYTLARSANLESATFSDEVDFSYTDLSGGVIGAATLQDAKFAEATLEGVDFVNANLVNADFSDALLSEATLDHTNLEDGDFTDADHSEASLVGADCEGAKFVNTVLVRASLEAADLVGADLTGAYFFGTRLEGARVDSATRFTREGTIGEVTIDDRCRYDTDTLPDDPVESISLDKNEVEERDESPRVIQLQRGSNAYRRLEELARQNGLLTLQSTMFRRRQEMRRKLLWERGERIKGLFMQVQRGLFVYGESFSRVLGISVGIVVLFWLLFLTTGTVQTISGETVTPGAAANDLSLVWQTLYHSILLFFTGNGPLTPTNAVGQVFTAVESIAGPILLALLIFVLGRRAAK